jgi:hypothetical protein
VLIFSTTNSAVINYVTLDRYFSFKDKQLQVDTLNAVTDFKCTDIATGDQGLDDNLICTVTQKARDLLSLRIKIVKDSVDGLTLELDKTKSGSLKQVANYIPVYVENWVDLAIVKARAYHEIGNVADEKIFLYNRGDSPSEYVVAGLYQSDYAPGTTDKATPSLPILVTT